MHEEPHNTPGFISFNQVYELSANGALADLYYGIPRGWFPPEFQEHPSGALFDALSKEGRYQVRVVAEQPGEPDGYDYAALATLWFDGQPFAVVLTKDRFGGDTDRVWVTDLNVKLAALGYLFALHFRFAEMETTDLFAFAPGEEVAVETLLGFNEGIAAELGFPCPPPISPKSTGRLVLLGCLLKGILPACDEYAVVGSRSDTVPAWLRRGERYLGEPRPLSEQESRHNPRIRAGFQEDGFPFVWVYKELPRPPHYRDVPRY